MLIEDQERAIRTIRGWWLSGKPYFILTGRAGTGKTTITLELLRTLYKCKPLVTAMTNEAKKQLELVLANKYTLKTAHSALGYGFDTSSQHKQLKQLRVPIELEDYNLLVIDEASMLDNKLLKAIIRAKIRVLFIGHASQLPEVQTTLSVFDKCISVIFTKNFPTYNLTTPVRNTGDIYTFCNCLEDLIYAEKRILPNNYNFPRKNLIQYIEKQGIDEIGTGQCKVVGWTNELVDVTNKLIRKVIFKREELPEYVEKDKIILTRPNVYMGNIDKVSETKLLRSKNKQIKLTTNSKFTVRSVSSSLVLEVPCYTIITTQGDMEILLFIPKEKTNLDKVHRKYLYAAYGKKTTIAKDRAFRTLHFIMSLFAEVKHSYALTTYRAQGMTISKVIVRSDDINRCPNAYLKHKLLYVSASRASNELMIIR